MKSEVLVLVILGAVLGELSIHGEKGMNAVEVQARNEQTETTDGHIDSDLEIDRKKGSNKSKKSKPKKIKPKPEKPNQKPPKPKPTKPSTTLKPTLPDPESYETEMLKQLDFATALANSNLNSKDEKNCTKELKALLKKCKETEDIIEKLQFKKPFIRSTEVTNKLGRDSRLFIALRETITRVSSDWTSFGGGESLIKFFSQEFQDWALKGGGLSILQTKPESTKSGDEDVTCDAYLLYRRMDGKCNNLVDKYRGSANIALKRFFPNRYEDGFSVPRGGLPISSLPSARVVSRKMHHASAFPSPLTTKGYTHMVMQFGQFLDHDITLTADMELDCCNSEMNNQTVCFNIDITGDDFYSGKTTCHPFTRSLEIITDSPTREQINGITAYIDASNVYGSDDVLAKKLRTLVNGRLKTHANGPMLPTRRQVNLESHGPAQLDEDLVAGDIRAIEQPTLASIHSLFLSEHNRIADELRSKLSDFLSGKTQSEQDEILYQESRKLVGAEMQNIVYNEFLPIVLGQDELTNHNLQLSTVTTYDDTVDASIRNEFATVAFRFGHSLISGLFNGNGGRRLKLSYFDEDPEFVSGRPPNNNGTAWYSELEQCAKQRCPKDDVVCTEDVTNFLYSNTRGAATNFGDDLPARNIQRGRDHGLPSYNEFRSSCGLTTLKNFQDDARPIEITAENWEKLKKTYNNVNDIDAFSGGLAETAPSDGLVGPTFACIIGRQFNFLKFGDRFFFNNDNANGLKVNSRETIRRRTLRDIICENTNAVTLQKYVMKEEDAINNPLLNCTDRTALHMDAIAVDITGDGSNVDLEVKVTELEASVEMLKADLKSIHAALTTKCDASQCNANTAALDTKCDATTCSNIHASTTDIETCLGDVSSLDCPSSPHGTTGLAAALADKCDSSTCEALETATSNNAAAEYAFISTRRSFLLHNGKDSSILPFTPPDNRDRQVVQFLDDRIIVCGGGPSWMGPFHQTCYQLSKNCSGWISHSREARYQAASTAGGGSMFVMGGYVRYPDTDDPDRLHWSSSIERYDVKKGYWNTSTLQMPQGSNAPCAVTLDDVNIMLIGGNPTRKLAHILNIEDGNWTRLPDTINSVGSSGCAVGMLNGRRGVFVAGGYGTANNKSQFFDIDAQAWEALGDLNVGHHPVTMTSVNGVPLFFGKDSTVEMFDGSAWNIIDNNFLGDDLLGSASTTIPEELGQWLSTLSSVDWSEDNTCGDGGNSD